VSANVCKRPRAKEGPRAQGASNARADATPLVKAMLARYASLRSYEDSGTATLTVRRDGGAPEPARVEFHTLFARDSGGFLFDIQPADELTWRRVSDRGRIVIWREAAGSVSARPEAPDAASRFSLRRKPP
jgi:hypothetical protein